MVALVVFDTNALLLPFERRISIEKELERLLGPFEGLVPDPCLAELRRITHQERGGRRDRARMALSYGERFQAVSATPPADQAALEVAQARGAYLFTNDSTLVKRALALRVPVIRMKGLSHLTLLGPE